MEKDTYERTFMRLDARRSNSMRINSLLRIYTRLGALIGGVGAGYLIFSFIPVDLAQDQYLALSVSGIGVALAVMSKIMVTIRNERMNEEIERMREFEHMHDFLDTWTEFEHTSKMMLAEQGESFNKRSFRSVLLKLQEKGRIAEDDVVVLEDALVARNFLVHGNSIPLEMAARLRNLVSNINKKILMTGNSIDAA